MADPLLDSAPKMTLAEWQQELSSLSEGEKNDAIKDLFGRVAGNVHTTEPLNTTQKIEVPFSNEDEGRMLALMDMELNKIPAKDFGKACFLEALQKCPESATCERLRLQCLRCEDFNPQCAAHRLLNYWTKKKDLFGAERAFLPLTMENIIAHDAPELLVGGLTFLPGTDSSGRGLLYVEGIRFVKDGYSVDAMTRVLWYLVHVALEIESVRQQGIVVIGCGRGAGPEKCHCQAFRSKLVDMLRNFLPVKVRAVHLCHPPLHMAFGNLVVAAFKFAVGRYLRSRLVVHVGSVELVVSQLEQYGIAREQLPVLLGGDVEHDDFLAWIAWRKVFEG